jgi:uncharacterized protein
MDPYIHTLRGKNMEMQATEKIPTVNSNEQLSMKRLLSLVFIPAILLLVVFVASCMLLKDYIPVYLCLLLCIIVVIVPFEIIVIGNENKNKFGKFGLQAAFRRHAPMSWWKIILMAFLLFSWAGLVFALLQPVENSLLIHWVFKFVPAFLYSTNFSAQLALFPKWIIAVTCIVNLVFNGVIAPIVEELYFRGYLMSRLERFGNAAPFIVAVLFSLYHLFTPWENITRIIAFIPLHYVVWKKKNLYIGMLTHCACNLVGAISLFGLLFAS